MDVAIYHSPISGCVVVEKFWMGVGFGFTCIIEPVASFVDLQNHMNCLSSDTFFTELLFLM